MKNRIIAAAAAAAALAGGPAAAQEQITWWYETATPEQQGHIAELLVGGFQAAYPDYTLTLDYRGQELDKQLRVALLSGGGPDVVQTPGPSFVASMARNGQLLALDSYAAQYSWDDRILKLFLDLGRYDGKLYALPKTYETLGLFYNKTLFEENGWEVPTTIPELEALADKALAKGLVPMVSGNANWRPANEWHLSIVFNSVAGPDNVYKALTGEIPWTADPFVRAVDTMKRWWDAGYYGPDYFSLDGEQQMAALASGKAAMLPTGTWSFQNVPTYFDGSGYEPGFAGFPSAPGVPSPIYALGIGTTFSINANSGNPDGAASAIDFVFTKDYYSSMNSVWQGEWNLPLRDLTGVQLSADVLPQYIQAMNGLASTVDANQYGYTTWTFWPPATNQYMITGIEDIWFDKITTAEYLARVDETFQEELAEGKVPAIPAR